VPDNDQIDQLEREQTNGNKASKAYENWVQPFIKAKKELLFQAFNDLPITATADLSEVKRMMQTLDAFENEMKQFIDTGKMAGLAISESMPKDEEKH